MFAVIFLRNYFFLVVVSSVGFIIVDAAGPRKLQQSCVVYASLREACPPITLNSEGKFRLAHAPVPPSLSCLLILETNDGWRSGRTRNADGSVAARASELV